MISKARLGVLQLHIDDRDVAPALEIVSLDDLVTIDDLASLRVDKVLRRPVAGLGVELVEPVCPKELRD